jgi:hypothetical protein
MSIVEREIEDAPSRKHNNNKEVQKQMLRR